MQNQCKVWSLAHGPSKYCPISAMRARTDTEWIRHVSFTPMELNAYQSQGQRNGRRPLDSEFRHHESRLAQFPMLPCVRCASHHVLCPRMIVISICMAAGGLTKAYTSTSPGPWSSYTNRSSALPLETLSPRFAKNSQPLLASRTSIYMSSKSRQVMEA